MPKSPFTIACCSLALRNRPMQEAINIIADAGYDGIEILYRSIETLDEAALRELAQLCVQRNLPVVAISPYFMLTRGREVWLETMKTAEKVLQAGAIFGAKKVRTFVDAGPDGLPSCRADENHWKAAIEGLQTLCAMDPSVEFVVETHNDTLADTLPSVQRLFSEVNKPNLRLNYQAITDFMDRGFFETLETLYPLMSHMHWEQVLPDGNVTYIDEPGSIDFPKLLNYLVSKGYTGTASVEFCWTPIEESRVYSAWKFLSGIAPWNK